MASLYEPDDESHDSIVINGDAGSEYSCTPMRTAEEYKGPQQEGRVGVGARYHFTI